MMLPAILLRNYLEIQVSNHISKIVFLLIKVETWILLLLYYNFDLKKNSQACS